MFRTLLFETSLTDHHTRPFQDLIHRWLPRIIEEKGHMKTVLGPTTHNIRFRNYRFVKPQITPATAHQFNITYRGTVVVDIVYGETVLEDRVLCEFPVVFDGGSLVINGKRRFIPMLVTPLNNFPSCYRKADVVRLNIRSDHHNRQNRSTSTLEVHLRNNTVWVTLPFLKPRIPLAIILVALGFDANAFQPAVRQAWAHVWQPCLDDYSIGEDVQDQLAAFAYINRVCKKKANSSAARYVVTNEILPHVMTDCRFEYFVYLVGLVLLTHHDLIPVSDRDSCRFSKVTDSSTSLAVLFLAKLNKFTVQAIRMLRKNFKQGKPFDPELVLRPDRLTRSIESAVATGTWSAKRFGISHQLVTTNELAVLAQLRRVTSSFLKNKGKHMKPRMLHHTSYGYFGAANTTEGAGCGLVFELASTARVTHEEDPFVLRKLLLHRLPLQQTRSEGSYLVFGPLGRILGHAPDIRAAKRVFVRMRRSLVCSPFVSQATNHKLRTWHLFSEVGRLVRPLVVMENAHKLPEILRRPGLLVPQLLAEGVIEYVAPCEIPELQIAFRPNARATHLEVCDVAFVGIIAAMTPFFRHDPGSRVTYGTVMRKAAIHMNTHEHMGAPSTQSLWYGQTPLVETSTARVLGSKASGINMVVLIAPDPRNPEDALILKRSFVERGGMVSDTMQVYESTRTGSSNSTHGEMFEKPDRTVFSRKFGSYAKLRSDGLPRPRDVMAEGDVVIGKTLPIKRISSTAAVKVPARMLGNEYRKRRVDNSVQTHDPGVVHDVMLLQKTGVELAKIRLRVHREPGVGDKFTSRHAQKATISRLEDEENLPFSAITGMTPDLVMNPHSYPSRTTVGELIEGVCGKAAALEARRFDDDQDMERTAKDNLPAIERVLLKCGFSRSGKEPFIDGRSGQPLQSSVFTGLISYSRLNHLAKQKSYARATGPVRKLTRQPNEGRRHYGGLRWGAMVNDCANTYGISEVVRERMFTLSDKSKCYVCAKCGQVGAGNIDLGYFFCHVCRSSEHMRTVMVPHSSNLVRNEQMGMGIKMNLELRDV